jgi:predicted lipid-binding transport protein (Tim44 family)
MARFASILGLLFTRDRIVEGERSEVTELWTFMRAPGGSWLLSAIQQT